MATGDDSAAGSIASEVVGNATTTTAIKTSSTMSAVDNGVASESAATRKSLEEIKAAARAYALSSTTSSKKRIPAWQKGLPKPLQQQQPQQQQQRNQKGALPPNRSAPKLPPARKTPYQITPGRYTLFANPHNPATKHATTKHTAAPPSAPPSTHPSAPPSAPPSGPHPPPPPPPYHYLYGPPPGYPPAHTFPYYYHPHYQPPPPQRPKESACTPTAGPAGQNSSAASKPSIVATETGPTANADVLWTAERILQDDNLDDYDRFVKGLNLLDVDDVLKLFQDDDEEEYTIQEEEEEEEELAEDDDDDADNEYADCEERDQQDEEKSDKTDLENQTTDRKKDHKTRRPSNEARSKLNSSFDDNSTRDNPEDWEGGLYQELAVELGWLEEEDIEAAVASLLDHNTCGKNDDFKDSDGKEKITDSASTAKSPGDPDAEDDSTDLLNAVSPSRARPTTGASNVSFKHKTVVTPEQYKQISTLLQQHFQLLVQQAVLTVRAAHYHKYHRSRTDRTDFLAGGETADDLVEILDAAVGMLQDLGQNRKDAIRHHLQFHAFRNQRSTQEKGQISGNDLTADKSENSLVGRNGSLVDSPTSERRLTRAQFQRTLVEQSKGEQSFHTVFDIRGLLKLDETFAVIDKSVQHDENNDQPHLLELESSKEACEYVLNATNQLYDKSFVPGSRDISENFCDPTEFLGPNFKPPCDEKQQASCRRNRNLFTAGEDNLVLRGVNLYGEKQWMLISDRFLPERSTNIISQRYSKLCVLLYQANGIKIDSEGRLETPPKLESIDDIDEQAMSKLRPVQAPAILNVHRWSLEEDLTLLKAVPITGHMWAELGARLIPHRDRGHLRKRYQVLERRVKSTVDRSNKRIKTVEEVVPRSTRVSDGAKRVLSQSHPMEARPSHSFSPPRLERSHATAIPSGKTGTTDAVDTAAPADPARSEKSVAPLSAHPHATFPNPPYSYPGYVQGYPYGYYPYGSPYQYPPPPYMYAGSSYDPYGPREKFEKLANDGSNLTGSSFEKLVREGTDGSNAALEKQATREGREESRSSYDKLSQEGANDFNVPDSTGWSQMSELIKTENMVAISMAVDLARSPSKPEVENRKGGDKTNGAAKSSIGLLAGVMERVNKSEESKLGEAKALTSKEKSKLVSSNVGEPKSDSAEESKELSGSPQVRDGVIFSTDGSRIGLSPAFQRSPGASVWNKMSVLNSPSLGNLSMASFPAASHTVGFSPSQNNSPPAEMTPPAHSLDSVALQQLGQSGQSVSSKRKTLFPETLSENDLEAISGLNLMASSPALPPQGNAESANKRKDLEPEARSSLFAKAVGEKRDDRKKRKLIF